MDNNREIAQLLQKIEENGRKQLRTGRFLCLLAGLCLAGGILLAVWVAGIVPQMEAVLKNLECATAQLAGVDMAGMVEDVDQLVVSTQKTMEGISHIDFETLNQAIRDLAAVIEPLAKWFR